MSNRQHVHWVDGLKVLAVLGVFVYHSAMVYAYVRWVITNQTHSVLLSLFAGVGFSMGMPLLFLLSGAASFFALRKLGAGRFVSLRFRRLIIPMLAGLVLLSPLQAYLSLRSRGSLDISLGQYYQQFFTGMDAYFSPRWLANYGYHLWFLGFLFLYSAIGLPVFSWLGGRNGRRFTGWLAGVCLRPGGLVLFVAPPAVVQMVLRARFPWYTDWADFAYWLMFFVAGYVLLTDPRFQQAIAATWQASLAIVAGSAAILGAFALVGLASGIESNPEYSLAAATYYIARTVNTWSVVVLVLALGIHAFNRPNRWIDHGSEAVLPFYVLHHPVVVLVAFFVVQWNAGLWIKFGVQTVLAFALTMGLYELIVRPFNSIRQLFGLKPRARVHEKVALESPPAGGPHGPPAAGIGGLASG